MTIYELRYINDGGQYETDLLTERRDLALKALMNVALTPRLLKKWFVQIWDSGKPGAIDMCPAQHFLAVHYDPYSTYLRLLEERDKPITNFTGPVYQFLSNFSKYSVNIEGLTYPTSENAYQALKCHDPQVRKQFTTLSPEAAMILGRAIVPWTHISDDQRVENMRRVLLDKFRPGRLCWLKLMATRDRHLSEVNTWGDKLFGMCDGEGENQLGKILMDIRSSYQQEGYNEYGYKGSPEEDWFHS